MPLCIHVELVAANTALCKIGRSVADPQAVDVRAVPHEGEALVAASIRQLAGDAPIVAGRVRRQPSPGSQGEIVGDLLSRGGSAVHVLADFGELQRLAVITIHPLRASDDGAVAAVA